jgi:hypothetical protein
VTPTKLNSTAAPTVVVADNEVTTAKILDANVTNAKLASDIDASKLTTGTLPIARIADGAVSAAKLDGAQTGSAPIYGCRAWVNFNGARNATNTGASTNGANVHIRASGNVASVLKNGTGDYTVTFTTAMADANYAIVNGSSQSIIAGTWFGHVSLGSQTASSFSVLFSRQDNGSLRDEDQLCMLAIFR